MTPIPLTTFPSFDALEEFKEKKSNTIYIKSSIMRGILIESAWRVSYEKKSIYLQSSNLISHHAKIPLPPHSIPDRHLRSARKIGAALFDLKRFDNLIQYKTTKLSVGYSATRGEETFTFSREADAKLWTLQRGVKSTIKPKSISNKSEYKRAFRNSSSIRTDMLKLMLEAVTGISAIERFKTLLKRGADPKELEKIWRDSHGGNIIPDVLKSIFYGKETKA